MMGPASLGLVKKLVKKETLAVVLHFSGKEETEVEVESERFGRLGFMGLEVRKEREGLLGDRTGKETEQEQRE